MSLMSASSVKQKIKIEEIAKSVDRSQAPYWNFSSKVNVGDTVLNSNANVGYIDVSSKTVQTGFLFKFRHDNPTFKLYANGTIYASIGNTNNYKQYTDGQQILSISDTGYQIVYAYKNVE
ncbi:hypothetical protein [uncultured Subdoligranulum sp.]|uniref:hypothetical protein n=1 Tax=uncultured Subdoligranulum sp. TaxID=512298 RepID=UPI0025DA65DF|nr:hypothetical protein [uncultured Subdoligranulum sp.]